MRFLEYIEEEGTTTGDIAVNTAKGHCTVIGDEPKRRKKKKKKNLDEGRKKGSPAKLYIKYFACVPEYKYAVAIAAQKNRKIGGQVKDLKDPRAREQFSKNQQDWWIVL